MQTYENHRKVSVESRSHKIYFLAIGCLFVFSIIDLSHAIYMHRGRFTASLFVTTSVALMAAYFLFRSFALKAQDRAIRAEENLRYFAMTGKLFDKAITIQQIFALRFASDEEFIALTDRALKEMLSNDDIKKAIKTWREDNHRA